MSEPFTVEWLDLPGNSLKIYLAIAQLIYGLPTITLMLFLFFFLGCSKKYKGSFYRLVQMDLLINVICWTNTWISLRSSEFSFGTVYVKLLLQYIPWLWNISSLSLNFFFHMQLLSAASMSIHRISSFLFYNSYEKFWSRYYLLIIIFFFIYSWIPINLTPGHPSEMNLINGTLYFTFDLVGLENVSNMTIVFSVIYFFFLVGIGFTVSVIAGKRLYGIPTEISKKLTRIALTYGFVYSGILFWNMLNAFQSKFNLLPAGFESISYSLLSLASDLMTLALPYILLIFDTNIKRDLRHSTKTDQISILVVSS